MMKTIAGALYLLGAALAFVVSAAPANAQATRTWVSGVGDDANPCSRTAPCKTFAGAISKTARGGEISVLDPGGFGNVTITKSITINGTPGAGYGSILVPAASTGIIINIIDPADTLRTVRLNWLDINGAGTAANGIRILSSVPGSKVVVENTNIDGFTGRGISDERTSGGRLAVNNTSVRHAGGAGIIVFPSSGPKIDATIHNVRSYNNQAGIAALGGIKMMISNSDVAGNTIGLDAEGANTEIFADNVSVSGNGTGLFTTGGGAIRLSNANVAFNTTGVIGTVNSHSNNRFLSNGAGGTISAVAPAGTNPSGQQ